MSADKIMEITMQMKTKRNGARQDSKELFFLFFQSANAKSARGRARKREKLAQKVDHASANVPESFLLFMLIFFVHQHHRSGRRNEHSRKEVESSFNVFSAFPFSSAPPALPSQSRRRKLAALQNSCNGIKAFRNKNEAAELSSLIH